MKKVNVGIDLGTTYSAVASFSSELSRVVTYKNSYDKECTPSVICFDGPNVIIGESAKEEQKSGNTNTVAFYKSMMGNSDYTAFIDGNEYSAEDLSAIFLKNLVKDIEETNNIQIEGAVITVPAYFNEKQKCATIRAGEKAGLKVLRIINEPTAAIIAYGLTSGNQKNVMVYDLGGGTFDVTIAHVNGTKIDVMATNGNHQLGGKDWDQVLYDDIRDQFYSEFGIDIDDFPNEAKELQVKCEEAKKRLSSVESTQISIQCDGMLGKYTVTREMFDDRTYSLLYETQMLINYCFDEISEDQGKKFGWKDIDEVVLVGGSTRMPQIKNMIINEYGKAPITKDINVDTIVATGAAMQAELCVNQKIVLSVSKKPENPSQPASRVSLTIMNSDIQDITSYSLGMLALASDEKSYINSIIIKKNSKLNEPYSREYSFKGEKLQVYVLQGESRDPYDCVIIGKYIITGMDKSEKNNIIVDFLYNSNGVVEVTARIKNGKSLIATREDINSSMSDIIAQLEKEREEAKRASKVEVMFMIDSSGSMCGSPMQQAKRAAIDFVSEFNSENIYISVVEFADKSVFNCRYSNKRNEVVQAINYINPGKNVGVCNYECPITSNYKSFHNDVAKVMVILTDGVWVDQNKEIESSRKAKESGIIIYAIGFGDADEDFLRKISSEKGARKVDLSKLNTVLKEVANTIATEVNSNSIN